MSLFFFFNDTATTEIYTLSLHDALPICIVPPLQPLQALVVDIAEPEDVRQHDPFGIEPAPLRNDPDAVEGKRSEEHTSELQSLAYLVCRLLLEKKKKRRTDTRSATNQHR